MAKCSNGHECDDSLFFCPTCEVTLGVDPPPADPDYEPVKYDWRADLKKKGAFDFFVDWIYKRSCPRCGEPAMEAVRVDREVGTGNYDQVWRCAACEKVVYKRQTRYQA